VVGCVLVSSRVSQHKFLGFAVFGVRAIGCRLALLVVLKVVLQMNETNSISDRIVLWLRLERVVQKVEMIHSLVSSVNYFCQSMLLEPCICVPREE